MSVDSPRTRRRHARPTRWQRLIDRTRDRTIRPADLRPVRPELRVVDGEFPARVALGASPDASVHAATGEAPAEGHTRRTACGRTFLKPHREYTPRTGSQKRSCEQCRTALET